MTWSPIAPNTLKRQKKDIILDIQLKALAIIASDPEKCVENTALAEALGLDPRGTRDLIGRCPHLRPQCPISGRGLYWIINPGNPHFTLPANYRPKVPLMDAPTRLNLTKGES